MKKNDYGKILKDGVITQNPVLVQVLGMCPTLAVSTALLNGLGMGVAVTMVLVFSNLFISLLRKVIDKRIRIASFIVIIAGFVTMVEMLMKAYLPSLSASLGVYIPLIVVNCIILARAEAFASRNKPLPSVVDGFACGIGFTAAICIVSAIRELLGTGALLGYDFKLIPPIMIFTLAPGGLLVLGFVMAFCAWISARRKRKAAVAAPAEAKEPEPKPTGEGKVMEKAPLPPQKIALAETAAETAEEITPVILSERSEPKDPLPVAEASPVQGEVAPKATEGLPAAEKPAPEPVAEAAEEITPVILSEAAEAAKPKDPLPVAEASPVQGEVAPKAPEGLSPAEQPAPAPEPAAETQMTFAAVEEAEAPAPEESAREETPAEPVSFGSEEEHEAALAAALRYFGGMEASPVQSGEAEAAAAPLPPSEDGAAPVILSDARSAETKEPLPIAEEPEKAGDSSPASPSRNDAAPAPDSEPRRRSLFSRRKAREYDDDLEPPSFMSEPVTRPRENVNREERDDG